MNLRTPVKDARGLGSAKDGVHHWWVQRLSAVALVPLVLWFAFSLAINAGGDYEAARAWIGSPFTAGAAILLIAAAFYHAQLGLQVVLEDYVDNKALEIVSLVVVKFLAAVLALTGILAVLSIAFGG
ncbi:succinate dehydrogenase, hydrophobic membrane anchor protein [Aquisalimonas sp.]|uniref:succinate dehydrogenase, hydrophobic membrane anchor protein n=1 Tax=unclassified Aquisalimonas TaxID=2644645 RepID=UPI0025C2246A|nr:succinate dehydrogenase, hydrophobic membrane anchor protein [Aquisalimonas sp.]